MKKRLLALVLALLVGAGAFSAAAAAGGGADDPLISLSYLKNTFKPALTQVLRTSLITSSANRKTVSERILMDQDRYKEGDVAKCSTGAEILVLAGSAKITYSSGSVVNATDGAEISSGTTLALRARYIVAEDTVASLTVTSATAVISLNGAASLSVSAKPDYNAMADALHTLGLFQGTGSGYGSGYDLEQKPTRIQGLVMFLRLLGEEDDALAYNGVCPFSDVPTWGKQYVSYAYSKGYTNGISKTSFGSNRSISAAEYVEFVMRALKYSSVAHTDTGTTLNDAQNCGLLTGAEYTLLKNSTFLRAHIVYVSYYALTTPVSGSTSTLEGNLLSAGVFTTSQMQNAHTLVSTARL